MLLALAPAVLLALTPGNLTLERIFSDPPLDGRAPAALSLSPGGKVVAFLQGSAKDSDVQDLWGASLPSGTPALLVSTEQLLGNKEQKLTEQEKMQLERKRISKRGITSYLWCGDDAKALVFPLSGDLYYVTLADKNVERLTNDEDKPELNPVCSKSGKKIAFVKDDAVVVLDVQSKKATRISAAGSSTHHWGLPEFIAEEEMDRHEGMWWAPDEKSLLVFEVNEDPVGKKTRAQIFADHTEMFEQRYPAAGEKNALVNAWLISVDGSKKRAL
ncbi:MAG TPA: DPP IV N-terminal domain-containing protein, partial [Myxococcota bacterium]